MFKTAILSVFFIFLFSVCDKMSFFLFFNLILKEVLSLESLSLFLKKHKKMNWIPLVDINQLDLIIEESKTKGVVIFKHSTRCIISKMALRGFESDYTFEDDFLCYYLDLIAHRDISNEIAARFGIEHQSPQILIIKDGVVVYNESHEGIEANALKGYL